MQKVLRSLMLRYIVAVLAVALALLLTFLLWPILKPNSSLLFFAAVMFSAWYGGLGPGLLSTVLSTLASFYFFESPVDSLVIYLTDFLRLGIFVLVSLLISSLNGMRQRTETALRKREEQLRLITDALPILISYVDSGGRYRFNNQTYEQWFGHSRTEITGKHLKEVVGESAYQELQRYVETALSGQEVTYEKAVTVKDSGPRYIRATYVPHFGEHRQVKGFVALVDDITDRKQAEDLLQTFASELERQVEARTAELSKTNAALEAEIAERQRAEAALFQSQQSIQRLYEIVATPHLDFEGKMQRLLAMGCDRFGLDIGILAHITGERYKVVEVQLSENLSGREAQDLCAIRRGDIFELGNTYCNETLRAKEPVSFEHAGTSDKWRGHPCYLATQLEAYIATPIIVSGEVYGTVNFSSPTPRQTPFQPADKEFLKLMAQWVGGEISRKQAQEELYQREQQFKAVVENTPDVIMRCDRQLRYAYVNPAVERNTGIPAAEFIGKTTEETGAPPQLCQLWNETLLKVFDTGTEQVIEFQTPSVEGLRIYQSRIVPEFDKEGSTQYALVVARDITEIKQAEEERAQLIREQAARLEAEAAQQRSAFLVEASTLLASSLDYETTLKSVARLAVPSLADWCAVKLITEQGRIRLVEVAHREPAKVELAQEFYQRYPPGKNPQSPTMRALRTGKSQLIPEISDSLLVAVAQDDEYLTLLRELNFTSYMIVPLRVRGRILGAITFVWAESMRCYTPEDLDLAEEVAYRAAIAVDNALLYREAQQVRAAAEKAAERTARLQAVTAALSESLTPSQVAEVIVEQGVTALGANSAFIALLTESGTELEVLRAPGYDPAFLDSWHRFSINAPVPLAQAVRTGKPIWLESTVARIARYPHLATEYNQANYAAWISIPLMVEGRAVGGMSFSFTEAIEFSEDDRTFMLTLAQQCTQALERARLYEAERHARAVSEAALSAAQAANRTKDEFLATLSHELRTPLNAMLGWTNLLRTRKLDEATAARALETIDRNTKSLATLIEDVLDVSRIITGKLSLNIRPIEVIPVIEAAIDAVRSAAQAKEIQIELILHPSAAIVSGDPDRLQQVVWNLLSNAIKFTPKGGRVEVELTRIDSSVQMRVSDTGKGISPDFLPYVFERFRQENSTTTRSYGGLGLGLAIVRHLVEMHGGMVHAESVGEGQGATFIVNLPLRVITSETSALLQDVSRVGSEEPFDNPPALDGLRLLVVDDEPDARELLTTVLKHYRAEVKAVASVGEALEALRSWNPDVLISDIGMPLEDGYTLIRKVRALEPSGSYQLPALALTAYAREEDRIHALEAGFHKHLPKPIKPAELVNVVAQLVGRTYDIR